MPLYIDEGQIGRYNNLLTQKKALGQQIDKKQAELNKITKFLAGGLCAMFFGGLLITSAPQNANTVNVQPQGQVETNTSNSVQLVVGKLIGTLGTGVTGITLILCHFTKSQINSLKGQEEVYDSLHPGNNQ